MRALDNKSLLLLTVAHVLDSSLPGFIGDSSAHTFYTIVLTLGRLYNSNLSAAMSTQSSKLDRTNLERVHASPRVLFAVATLLPELKGFSRFTGSRQLKMSKGVTA